MKILHRWGLAVGMAALLFGSSGHTWAQEEASDDLDGTRATFLRRQAKVYEAYQLVFFSVLEGCFQDGLTDEDINQILLKSGPDATYEHFIYSCPICDGTARALEAYRARPDSHTKMGGKLTFGKGLPTGLRARLFSREAKERLSAIHDLEENWVSRHLAAQRLTPEELAHAQKVLKLAREDGLKAMQGFEASGQLEKLAPAYHAGDECALCNAAAGMKLKLAEPPPK